MIRWISILMGIYSLMLSSTARAEAGWTDKVTIIELIPTGKHYFELRLEGRKNPSGCREEDWFYINYEARGADKMFDLFVESIKIELRLRVYVTGVCNLSGYSEISAISAGPN